MEIKAKGYATLEKISPNLKGILSDSINKLSHHEE